MSFDTETNGLGLYTSTMVGFSVSFNDYSGFYIPILEWVPEEKSRRKRTVDKVEYSACMDGHLRCVWTGESFPEFVKPHEFNMRERLPNLVYYLQRWFANSSLVMHNGPFDVNQTYINAGVELKQALYLDTGLLVHVLDENNSTALKRVAERYKVELGINPHANAAMEKKELDDSIIKNGGKPGMVWRASLEFQNKYGCADTFLTLGVAKVAMREFAQKFGNRGIEWFFEKEVMPVCREVVIDMKRRGVYVDVPYFQKLFDQNAVKMAALEDKFVSYLTSQNLLADFPLGKSVEESISHQRFVKKIIELEGLSLPRKTDSKTGESKDSLAKAEVRKAYETQPHWVWGYVLGEDEIKYSEAKITQIKQSLYEEVEGRRYRFNLGSRDHLAWLFCDKLGMSRSKLPQTDAATKANPIPSISAEVIEEFILPKFPWVAVLLSYRKLLKLQSTYIAPALELSINGWLYMDMKQNGTTSGRFSCSGGYNLQTLPRVDDEMEILEACDKCDSKDVKIVQELECIADRHCNACGFVLKDVARPSSIKKGFVAPPGYKIIDADYSSLEPRCFAFVSGEAKLKQVYWDDLDLYSKAYCDMFDTKNEYSADPKAPNYLKKLNNAKRKWIKPIVLGIPYGAEDDQVANLIGALTQKKSWGTPVFDEDGKPVMVANAAEGKRIRDLYLTTYPELSAYMDRQDDLAVTLGYVETLLGRRRHLPFAKKINDVLIANNIDWKDLTHAPIWELKKGMNINYTSFRGFKVSLTEQMILQIQEAIKFKTENMIEKGYWAYIRSMLRSDLNNAKNNPIQGLAGHITNKGMLDTNRALRAQGLDAWVALQVHDEIMTYAKIEHVDAAARCLQTGMEKNEFTALLDVDMIAEPVICDNLKESK
jgi:DNA polymerase I-like protein with 3'-5' exonuclease and polymerase domains